MNQSKKQSVSIRDIARISGVSVATVSRVINNNGRFSEKTRQKVQHVIEETGYQMNFSAKSLRMNRTFTIGIIVPDISNYFFSEVVQKIEELLFDKNYSTIICNTGRSIKKETAYLNMLESKLVDGIVVISGANDFGFETNMLQKKMIPYVCIDREPKDKSHTIFISSNHYQGAYEATDELIKNGVQHPIIVMHQHISPSSRERLKGYKDALKNNNIVFNKDEYVLNIDVHQLDFEKKAEHFFSNHLEIDGIFAINDNIAIRLILVLKKLGKKIPEDLKIIGFDNNPQDEYIQPTLSSVKQNTSKLAILATNFLLELIVNPNSTNLGTDQLVPVELIRRTSSQK